MNVLVACEFSGIVRDAFRKRGHNAYSCDILPCEGSQEFHFQEDIIRLLLMDVMPWDLMIAHPPCTYLATCQTWRCNRDPERAKKRDAAVGFAKLLWTCHIPRICIENPKSQLSTLMAKKSQTIHPWQFGHGEQKETWLWLKNLPPLVPTNIVEGREQKVWKMAPGPDRWKNRSRTYQGIADAMAEQWGCL